MENLLIFDSHAHIIPKLSGASGFSSKKEHLLISQKSMHEHLAQPARKKKDNSIIIKKIWDDNAKGNEGELEVEFRVGKYGRFEWTQDAEDCYIQYLPTYVENMRSVSADNQPVGQMNETGELVIHSSDRRLKTDFSDIDNALDKVLGLKGVCYSPIENLEKRYVGLVAQDVEKIIPELVFTSKSGYMGVRYTDGVALLVEAIKEQQTKIDTLQQRLEKLESK